MCIHHYSNIQSISPTLKILCAPIHPFPIPPNPLATNDLFIISIVLPFPECHIVGTIQYVTFSDWLPSLNYMHLRFFHVLEN